MFDALHVKDVRCFHAEQVANLAPLTFLIGENSTGKSTVLALMRAAWKIACGNFAIDFNEPPFDLGAYDQIAHYRGGVAGRAKFFKVGFSGKFSKDHERGAIKAQRAYRVVAKFTEQQAQPQISEVEITSESMRGTISFNEQEEKIRISLSVDDSQYSKSFMLPKVFFSGDPKFSVPLLPYFLAGYGRREESKDKTEEDANFREISSRLSSLAMAISAEHRIEPFAFAPVRSKPVRTYHPVRERQQPEGEHVPMILAKASYRRSEWKDIQEKLKVFGRASGLFREIGIKHLGKKPSDPFQIKISIDGPAANLIDVGYGVSQSLPIIADTVLGDPNTTYLLQQPEVHLHPRAQAELGTFLATLVKSQNKRFIVETHSDYMLDRIRIEVQNAKLISKDDVSILYFERRKSGVVIHPMKLSEAGDLLGVPRSYRSFFMSEERRLLGLREE